MIEILVTQYISDWDFRLNTSFYTPNSQLRMTEICVSTGSDLIFFFVVVLLRRKATVATSRVGVALDR